ncbi:MAG: 50S ribosomal protein L9 [Candidatus Omnitrophota bacterium]
MSDIQVVLTETDPKLGERGQVLKVSRGYAVNFLFPGRKALPATPANLRSFEKEKARQSKEKAEARSRAEELAGKIGSLTLTVEVPVGEGEKLYGSVTSQEVQRALAGKGASVDRKDIHLEEPIRKLGSYEIPVKLHRDVSAVLKLQVVKKK